MGVTLPDLHAMKRAGRKIVGVVAWDYQLARIVDRAGVDIVSVGDTVGVNLWGQTNPLEVTMDQMVLVAQAVRRGVSHALLSCDFPYGPLQEGPDAAVRAAIRLVKEAGVDMVKLDGAADHLDAVAAVTRAGIPVFAQFGLTPQTALRHGVAYDPDPGPARSDPGSAATGPDRAGSPGPAASGAIATGKDPAASRLVPVEMKDALVAEAKALEAAGAVLLNFTNSGPVVGPEVTRAVAIPVVGGHGGGPWLDGRVRMATAAIGYAASTLDDPRDRYAEVARTAHDAIAAYAADVRAARQIRS
ncbi:3-methyl-2-oxobutanoate hydroxymethyltransferase [Phytohabitans suffuscus]|uniref:3-methyl-2-oxobutanoate hydroxymethyltransferase n=1 Tax=Phytohabitans suffuscus TaxID=624315 RepID=A0A6F8YWQ0_9ACTN|nr:3-methyl-2-oxobutanoate hydroxymethyltransferase [Phytohabitans suffuscus]BCB90281.1 3-methyl-2-oxobutanoate hydroxymethyltransferase [Phytohabitans suffuscus]